MFKKFSGVIDIHRRNPATGGRLPRTEYKTSDNVACKKRLNRWKYRLGCVLGLAQGTIRSILGQDPPWGGQFWEKGQSIVKQGRCREHCKNGWTDRYAGWVADISHHTSNVSLHYLVKLSSDMFSVIRTIRVKGGVYFLGQPVYFLKRERHSHR